MILGNSTMIPELSERMMTDHGQNFRDGLPYAHALVAVREVLDQQELPAWNSSVYGLWLAALRTLSEPTTDEQYPEAMRTRAWALKDVSTQLASWTHIRHDNVLYAKESYTPGTTCDYPAGFVEPRIRFWQAMNDLAAKTRALLQSLPFTGDVFISDADPFNPERWILRSAIKDRQSAFLSQFADCMTTLAEISRKELAQERLTASETAFLKGLIEARFSYYGIRTFSGWYPSLFYVPVRKEVAYDTLHPSDR